MSSFAQLDRHKIFPFGYIAGFNPNNVKEFIAG